MNARAHLHREDVGLPCRVFIQVADALHFAISYCFNNFFGKKSCMHPAAARRMEWRPALPMSLGHAWSCSTHAIELTDRALGLKSSFCSLSFSAARTFSLQSWRLFRRGAATRRVDDSCANADHMSGPFSKGHSTRPPQSIGEWDLSQEKLARTVFTEFMANVEEVMVVRFSDRRRTGSYW